MNNTPSKIQKVAVYSRKSRPEETNEVLKRQLGILVDMCHAKGWEYDIFQEVGSSQDINTELNKMLEKVQALHYDAVLVTEQSRLGRNDLVIAQVKQILTNYGVFLLTPTNSIDLTTQEGVLLSDMQTLVDKQEYLNTRKRLIRGKRQSAKAGNWVGGRTPVGYKYDSVSKRLVPDEYAPLVERIFRLYLSGLSSTDIARQFELEGILTPSGSKWDKARIAVVLANPAYKGTVIYGKTKVSKVSRKPSGTPRQFKATKEEQIIIDDAHAPIVSPEDWERVRAIREQRNSKPPSARIGKGIFTGLIKCGICGRTHSFQRRKGKEIRITSCQTRHYQEDSSYTVCENKGMRLDKFEQLFYFQFEDFVKALGDYLDDIKNNIPIEAIYAADERESIEQAIKKHGQTIKKVQRGYENGGYTDEEFAERIKELRTQITQLEQELNKLDSKNQDEQIDELEASINKLRGILNGTAKMCTSDMNSLLSKYIDYIEYTRIGDHTAEPTLDIKYKGQEQTS
ncbi:recombinase [Bacillus cereus]|uniref:recombinase family protein n=1 Tax=Bacillus cereus TaxID=1396 RepID=UPI000BF720E8|nr:recombinase family protein [Bacillus cereus]PFR27139.1 recombinase [Bacillus cereus]